MDHVADFELCPWAVFLGLSHRDEWWRGAWDGVTGLEEALADHGEGHEGGA